MDWEPRVPEPDYAAKLKELQDAVDAIKEAIEEGQEAVENIEEVTEQLEELTDRINDARDNPESLDAEGYGDLVRDLIMVVPDNLPLPDKAKQAIGLLAEVVAAFIQGAVGIALSLLARRFRDNLRSGMTPEEAAQASSNTRMEQAWLLLQYKQGLVTVAGDTRDVQTPTERIWNKIVEFFQGLVSFFILGGPQQRLVAVGVFALVALGLFAIFAFSVFGGEDGAVTSEVVATQPPAGPTTAATSAATTVPTSESTTAAATATSDLPMVDVLIIGGDHYPVDQFTLSPGDAGCPNMEHWHSPPDRAVTSLEGTEISDPAPRNCGHGRVAEIPRTLVADPR